MTKPGLDPVDVDAAVREAVMIGYDSPRAVMVVTYAAQRWARGEEEGAMRTMRSHGIDLTSAYRIIAAARTAGDLRLLAEIGDLHD